MCAAAFGRRSRVKTPFLLPSTRMIPGRGGEVGEVPDLLADDRVEPVEDAVEHREHVGLVLLGPRAGRDAVQAGDGVGAVLGEDDRLVVLVDPGAQLRLEAALGGGEIAGLRVPAVVAVEHEHVEQVGDHVAVGRRGMKLAKPTGRVGSSRRVSATSGSK